MEEEYCNHYKEEEKHCEITLRGCAAFVDGTYFPTLAEKCPAYNLSNNLISGLKLHYIDIKDKEIEQRENELERMRKELTREENR